MSEYFIEIQGEKKTHSLRVEAKFTQGRDFVSVPYNEEDFLRPADPDEVEIFSVYLENENGREREITEVPEWLSDTIEEKIVQEERYGV